MFCFQRNKTMKTTEGMGTNWLFSCDFFEINLEYNNI